MRDRKLYDLLRRLSADERALFAEFLRSPLHAHRPKLADMVELMERLLFAAPEHPCSSEDFYAAFYPGKPYDSNNLNRLISVITSEFKEFLALRFFQRDRTARTACATREMSRRRWDDILPKEIALTRKVLQEELPDDEHNYYQLYCLEYENARHYMEGTFKKGETIYQPMLEATDRLFLLLKHKLKAFAIVYDRKFSTTHRSRWEEILDSESSKEITDDTLSAKMFAKASEILSKGVTTNNYEDYVTTLERELPYFDRDNLPLNSGRVTKTDSESLIQLGQNMSNSISQNQREFIQLEHLRHVRHGIEKGILLNEGYLQTPTFQNYIRIAAAMGKMETAWDFLNKNSSLLSENDQVFIPGLTTAMLYVFEGKAEPALKILQKLKAKLTSQTFFWNHLETRMLLCQCWHILGDFDSLYHESNAMRTFLDRITSVSKHSLLTYRRFLQAIMAIESAERKAPEKRTKKYQEILWAFETKPKFTGITVLRREIIQRHGEKLEYWRQTESGASYQ